MLILAIDTAHKNGSIALAEGDQASLRVVQSAAIEGGAFSAQLVPRVAQLLAQNGFKKEDLGAYVACVGPGSFTGLRIGLAGVKGLAEVLPRPVVAVSSLEALAASTVAAAHARLLVLLDAGRSEFYVGEYRREGTRLVREAESLRTSDELKAMLNSGTTVVSSQPAVAEFARTCGAIVFEVPEVSSEQIAEVGWRKLAAGETVSPDALDANYLRRDDALFAK